MKAELVSKLLEAHEKRGMPFCITVQGDSMNPVLFQGETITLKKQDDYRVGDIVVFDYMQEGILVHRLLKKKSGRYWCKGDNVYRTEEVGLHDIIGKVINKENHGKMLSIYPNKVILFLVCVCSRKINLRFRKVKVVKKVKQSIWYRIYKKIYLGADN